MFYIKGHIINLAKQFKLRASLGNQAPYDILGAVSLVLPIDIILLSDLTISKIQEWLEMRKICINTPFNNRHLHGFIITYNGAGFIFINGTDSEEERRFTVAHEVSHFLLDYQLKRDNAMKKMGGNILDVLDGKREATPFENIDSIIHSVDILPFVHLVEKNSDGSFQSLKVFNSENDADSLALELLAPHEQVISDIRAIKPKPIFIEFEKNCKQILISKYKLPAYIAQTYSTQLAYKATGGPSIMDKLGF